MKKELEDLKTVQLTSSAHFLTIDKEVLHQIINEVEPGDYIMIEAVQSFNGTHQFQYVVSKRMKKVKQLK